MQEPNTSNTRANVRQTGLTEFGDELPKKVGPFGRDKIEKVVKHSATKLGIDWDNISVAERKEKLGIAVDVLRGNLSPRALEDNRTSIRSDARTFGLTVLEEFKNSPDWDIDEYNRGYDVMNDAAADAPLADRGGSIDPGLQSNR